MTLKKNSKITILGQNENLRMIDIAVRENLPVLLIGETGCGKTTMVQEKGEEYGITVDRISINGQTTVDEFVGKYILEDKRTVWQDGFLLNAMKRGNWIVVDEVNAALPEILFALHSLLDDSRSVTVVNHDGETVSPSEGFRFFATMNPVEEYAGTKDLNKAFLSRFPVILNVEYPTPAVEREIVEKKGEVDRETATTITEIGHQIRKAKEKNEVFYTCSTRDLIQWARLSKHATLSKSFMYAVGNKAMSDMKAIEGILKDTLVKIEEFKKKYDLTLLEEIEAKFEKLELEKEEMVKEKENMKEAVIRELVGRIAM